MTASDPAHRQVLVAAAPCDRPFLPRGSPPRLARWPTGSSGPTSAASASPWRTFLTWS